MKMTKEQVIEIYNGVVNPKIREAFETLMPELRESEDERIRKAIECIIRVYGKTQGEFIAGYDMDTLVVHLRDAFAYLEKQKEPKHALRLVGDGLYSDPNAHFELESEQKPAATRDFVSIDALESCLLRYLQSAVNRKDDIDIIEDTKECKKQLLEIVNKEQKLLDTPSPSVIYTEMGEVFAEQKPAEKQDYTGLTDLERAIHRGFLSAGVENVPVTIIKETAQECLAHIDKPAEWSEDTIRKAVKEVGLTQHQINWFKRNVFPPKQEWSEEDEKIMQTMIKDGDLKPSEIAWLKSLRSRPIKADNWKPTKEQMVALLNAEGLVRANNYPENAKILASLYENLKKNSCKQG